LLRRRAAASQDQAHSHKPELAMAAHFSFTRLSQWIARQMGSPVAFVIAAVSILAWALSGPLFHYSDTWQLIVNTFSTIVRFLMVFVIRTRRTATPLRCTSSSTS
jgi:low affinity Fe/Cu permease